MARAFRCGNCRDCVECLSPLPEGETCASACAHAAYCAKLIGIAGDETHCDWVPSRFTPRAHGKVA